MADWRESAERKEWQKIEYLRLSEPEQAELAEMLKRVLPRKVRGHGIETFEGFIPPREARSPEEYEAARLLQRMERWQASNENMATYHQPLAEPLRLAIETLEDCGIDYEGYRETYLYWHPTRSGWIQIPAAIGTAIEIKRNGLSFDQRFDARKSVEWRSLYPWRECQSLFWLLRLEVFEPNTPIWHTLIILDWYEDFKSAFHEVRNSHRIHRLDALEAVLDAGRSGFQIGRSYEALLKKPFEPYARRGLKVVEYARSGAAARRGKLEPRTQEVLAAMERLVASGHSVSNAARLSAAKGIGESEVANRAAWYRRKRDKL